MKSLRSILKGRQVDYEAERKLMTVDRIFRIEMLVTGSPLTLTVDYHRKDMRIVRWWAEQIDEPLAHLSNQGRIDDHQCMSGIAGLLRPILKLDDMTEQNMGEAATLYALVGHIAEHRQEAYNRGIKTWDDFYNRHAWESVYQLNNLASIVLTDCNDERVEKRKFDFAHGLGGIIKLLVAFRGATADPTAWKWNEPCNEPHAIDSLLKDPKLLELSHDIIREIAAICAK